MRRFFRTSDILFYAIAFALIIGVVFIVHRGQVKDTQAEERGIGGAPIGFLAHHEDPEPVVEHKQVATRGEKIPILMYHHVGPLPEHPDNVRLSLTVSPEAFEQQVAWLSEQGYVSMTLQEVYESVTRGIILPKKSVVFTFDDGYSDVFTYAVPILQKYNFVGSFAVVTQLQGNTEYATWDQIRAAHKAGMEIISHTQNHFDGTAHIATEEYIYTNIKNSQADLERELGEVPPPMFIYPYGHYSDTYIEQLKKAGFVMALTTRFGDRVDKNDLFHVPRVRVHGQASFSRFKENLGYK